MLGAAVSAPFDVSAEFTALISSLYRAFGGTA